MPCVSVLFNMYESLIMFMIVNTYLHNHFGDAIRLVFSCTTVLLLYYFVYESVFM
jgi:hypothetical protein